MSSRAVVYESAISGERIELDLPLEVRRDTAEIRTELGLPEYVDVSDPQVARAVGILWAAAHAGQLAAVYPALGGLGPRLSVSVFGGVAIRFLCPSANSPGPFHRHLGDLDLVTTKSDGRDLVTLLVGLEGPLGSRFWHAVTKSDEMFNALRRGLRYRVHAAEEQGSGAVRGCILDVIAGDLQFCHAIPMGEAFAEPDRRMRTIGAAEMVLCKLQSIQAVDPDRISDEYAYRVIGELGSNRLIGPEDKDLLDASAILVDRGVGTNPGQVDPSRLGTILASDWGLAKTFRLNVDKAGMFEAALERGGADGPTIDRVKYGLGEILAVVDDPVRSPKKPRLRLSKTWWEVVEDHEHD